MVADVLESTVCALTHPSFNNSDSTSILILVGYRADVPGFLTERIF